jgi:hypothetical protein
MAKAGDRETVVLGMSPELARCLLETVEEAVAEFDTGGLLEQVRDELKEQLKSCK